MHRALTLLSLFCMLSPAGADVTYRGNFGFEADRFSHHIADKRESAFALRGEFEAKTDVGAGEAGVRLKAIWDREDSGRRYYDITELYYRHDFEDSELLIGRNTLFWGALEVYNLVDVFNTKDTLDDPFDYDQKLGAWNLSWRRYFESSELSVIVKLREENQRFQEPESVFNFLPLPYDRALATEYRDRPSLFVKYSGSGDEIQIDYAMIYEAGYDAQRYFAYDRTVGKLRQHAYWVNKVMGYATLVAGDTIYKAEGSLAASDDVEVSDYGYLGLGVEHTLYSIWEKRDQGFLAEYYGYHQFNDTKLKPERLGILFQNDLYLGMRFSFNDTADSEVLAGVDLDLDNQEKILFAKYETRVLEHYKVECRYQHLAPKARSLFPRLDHFRLAVSYYF